MWVIFKKIAAIKILRITRNKLRKTRGIKLPVTSLSRVTLLSGGHRYRLSQLEGLRGNVNGVLLMATLSAAVCYRTINYLKY